MYNTNHNVRLILKDYTENISSWSREHCIAKHVLNNTAETMMFKTINLFREKHCNITGQQYIRSATLVYHQVTR